MAGFLLLLVSCLCCTRLAVACFGATLLRSGGLSCNQKNRIIRLHNEIRSRVALGNEDTQPPAQNMMEMCWDDELAQQAQRWADQCVFAHDKNRRIPRFDVGQNLYEIWTSPYLDSLGTEPDFERAIYNWYNEVKLYGYSGRYKSETGHYSQMIWGDTFLVGCGYSCFQNGSKYTKLYVCNYGPAGNIWGQPPYNAGIPSCYLYGSSSSNNYYGLCVHKGCRYSKYCYYYH